MEALRGVKLTRTNSPFGLTNLYPFLYLADPIVTGAIRLAALSQVVFSGGYCEGETPVPIPNTAVKPHSADGTAWATAWESKSPPGSYR